MTTQGFISSMTTPWADRLREGQNVLKKLRNQKSTVATRDRPSASGSIDGELAQGEIMANEDIAININTGGVGGSAGESKLPHLVRVGSGATSAPSVYLINVSVRSSSRPWRDPPGPEKDPKRGTRTDYRLILVRCVGHAVRGLRFWGYRAPWTLQDGNNRIGTSKAPADEPQDIVLPSGAVDDEHCIIEVIPKADTAAGPSPPVSHIPRTA